MMHAVAPRPRPALGLQWPWLLVLALLVPAVFHGCHVGGHDDDLLKVRWSQAAVPSPEAVPASGS